MRDFDRNLIGSSHAWWSTRRGPRLTTTIRLRRAAAALSCTQKVQKHRNRAGYNSSSLHSSICAYLFCELNNEPQHTRQHRNSYMIRHSIEFARRTVKLNSRLLPVRPPFPPVPPAFRLRAYAKYLQGVRDNWKKKKKSVYARLRAKRRVGGGGGRFFGRARKASFFVFPFEHPFSISDRFLIVLLRREVTGSDGAVVRCRTLFRARICIWIFRVRVVPKS